MGSPFDALKNLPIVGEPKVIEWRPIVSCVCSCGEGQPMLITSTDVAVKCDGCGKLYALAALQYEQANGKGAMIGLMEVKPSSLNGGRPPLRSM